MCIRDRNNHSESLVWPGEVTPDNVEVHLRKNSADVDDSSHHDDGIVSDQYLIADDSAWFLSLIHI